MNTAIHPPNHAPCTSTQSSSRNTSSRSSSSSLSRTLRHALDEAPSFLGTMARFYLGAPLLPVAAAGAAVLSVAALGAWAATEAADAILAELRRRARLRTPRPPSPSLRGTPSAKELTDDALSHPRTLLVRLRLGSRLADLAPTLDSGNQYSTSPTGARRLVGRGRGVKGWLEDNRIPLGYSTLMRYKLLAVRLRALLSLAERIPLEWLLPGASPDRTLPSGTAAQCVSARRRLAQLLHAYWNFERLFAHVNSSLGIPRIPSARRLRTGILDDTSLKDTCRELVAFLQSPAPSPRLERLRCSALEGLSSGP